MLKRYLGNKTELLDPIVRLVTERASPGRLTCDIFSGTLSVALALKQHGFRVAANDINLFSYIIGVAYLVNNDIPIVPLESLMSRRWRREAIPRAYAEIDRLRYRPGFLFLEKPELCDRYAGLLTLLTYLTGAGDNSLPSAYRKTHIFDTYTEEGANSAFVSKRGREGRRRFFTPENGRRIDLILNHIRYWWRSGFTDVVLHSLLLSILMQSVERISNTQGTYHDFPRDFYDPRALKPLVLTLPEMDSVLSEPVGHILGKEEDSLEFISTVPEHDVLYIDPPYNFRQYTAYYFLPNLLCRYPDIEDLDAYFAGVEFVRGQNTDDDFVSTFCKPQSFIHSLEELITKARTETVILSYFDGKNHWNDFKLKANGGGRETLTEFLQSSLFKKGSVRVIPVPRLNYQSYGGYKAQEVSEFLFVAKKR